MKKWVEGLGRLQLMLVSLVALCVVAGVTWVILEEQRGGWILITQPYEAQYFKVVADNRTFVFNLRDPQQAPSEERDMVMLGYRIFLDTPKMASKYTGNKLSCVNCHFCAGNTTGDKNGAISLVGVTTIYPQFSKREHKMISLTERMQNCFMRSMNGRAPDPDALEMRALLTYLDWISQDVKDYKNIPWLGLPKLESKHVADPINGAKLYEVYCAGCHQSDGEGTDGIPPLWGSGSFNDGAGMNTLPMISSFIYLNMPYEQPMLTIDEALDIGSYIIQQPRPKFVKPQ